MSIQWEVTHFAVSTNEPALFANGYMQVAVHVSVRAVNPENNQPYTLTDQDLAGIDLTDYYSPNGSMARGWTFTRQENEFAHTMPTSADDSDERNDPRSRAERIWISTTTIETKSIGARIRQGNGNWVNTSSGPFDSHIVLRGIAPVRYTRSNTTFDREVVTRNVIYNHENYYLSSDVYPFQTAEVHGGRRDNSFAIEGMRMSNAMLYVRNRPRQRYIHYIWDMGPRIRVRAGITHNLTGGSINQRYADITIRDRPNAMCFTRLWITLRGDPFSNQWDLNPTWFRIWDKWGNWGDFLMDPRRDPGRVNLLEGNASAIEGLAPTLEHEDVPLEETPRSSDEDGPLEETPSPSGEEAQSS